MFRQTCRFMFIIIFIVLGLSACSPIIKGNQDNSDHLKKNIVAQEKTKEKQKTLSDEQEKELSPGQILKRDYPSLHALYQKHWIYKDVFEDYAQKQGFTAPFEHLATVVHEMIHVESATKRAFYVKGKYYKPFVFNKNAWTHLRVEDILDSEKIKHYGSIYNYYLKGNPKAHLGNILDEINAHSSVLEFIAKHEEANGKQQIKHLNYFLSVQEAFLHKLRIEFPAEYVQLLRSKSYYPIGKITTSAWLVLDNLGLAKKEVPLEEAERFLLLGKEWHGKQKEKLAKQIIKETEG